MVAASCRITRWTVRIVGWAGWAVLVMVHVLPARTIVPEQPTALVMV